MGSLLGLLVPWEPGERGVERELDVIVLMRQLVELSLVRLKLGDEVDEVLGFLELVQVLGVNHVAELVFNLDDELDDVEAVEAVLGELGVKGDLGLLGCAEVVLDDAENVLLDLVVVLEDQRVLLGLSSLLPEGHLAGFPVKGDLSGLLALEAEAVEEAALGNRDHHGSTLSERERRHELAEHFSLY